MSVTKTLTAAIAAATIVGTVGFVSAQTTTNDAAQPAATSPEPMPNNAMPADRSAPPTSATPAADNSAAPAADRSATPAQPMPSQSTTPDSSSSGSSSVPSSSSSDTSAAPAEPQPKADRN